MDFVKQKLATSSYERVQCYPIFFLEIPWPVQTESARDRSFEHFPPLVQQGENPTAKMMRTYLLNAMKGGVVGTTGFEPAAPASRTRCSTRLSHVPTGRDHTLFFSLKQVYFIPDYLHDILHPSKHRRYSNKGRIQLLSLHPWEPAFPSPEPECLPHKDIEPLL